MEQVITLDMVESGSTITACKMLGTVPESHEPDDFNLYVRTVGSTVRVDRSDTDERIVSGTGFARAMEALANHYGLPVVVQADPGVKVTKKAGELIGRYEPTTVVEVRALADRTPVSVGDLITVKDMPDAPVYKIVAFRRMDTIVSDAVTGLKSVIDDIRYVVPGWLTIPTNDKPMADAVPVEVIPVTVFVDDLIKDTVDGYTYVVTRSDEFWVGMRRVGEWREGRNIRTSDFMEHLADGALVNVSARLAMPEERPTVAVNPISEGTCGNVKPHTGCSVFQCATRKGAPTVEIHTGDGVITDSDVKARWTALNPSPFMDHIGHPRNLSGTHRGNRYCLTCEVPVGMPTPVMSDRDMADQVLAYLAPMVDDFYVDGIVGHLIKTYGGVVDINDLPEGDFSKIVAMFHKVTHVQTWGRAESAIWGGTATGLKRPVATLVNRRKRKASKVNKRRVKGGF